MIKTKSVIARELDQSTVVVEPVVEVGKRIQLFSPSDENIIYV